MATDQSVVIRTIDGDGFVRITFVLECVKDIEITSAVELTTEPGVTGRIGPSFPRSASFRARIRDNDPRTPLHVTARGQLFFLRSLEGKLFYLDTRSSPPEKITWTLENLKSLDDNQATGAWDVDITVREIIGGEFGEFIDPNELQTETGLVPVSAGPDASVLGIGGQTVSIDFTQAALRGAFENGAFGTYTVLGSSAKANISNHAAVADLYSPSRPQRLNQAAIAAVSSASLADRLFSATRAFPLVLPYLDSKTHVLAFGARLPEIVNCTFFTVKFTVLGVDFSMTIDATTRFRAIVLNIGSTAYALSPDASYIIRRAAKDPDAASPARRTDISYPQDMDLYVVLAPDAPLRQTPFTAENLPKFSILLIFAGGLAA